MENSLQEQLGIIEGLNKDILDELSKLEKDNENQAHYKIISINGSALF